MKHPLNMLFVLFAAAAIRVEAGPIAPEAARLYNLLSNPGFEKGGALPAWWRRFPSKNTPWSRHARDTKVFHSGRASGLVWGVKPRPKDVHAIVQWNRYYLAIDPGSALIVAFWVKAKDADLDEGGVHLGAGVHFYDAKGKHVGFAYVPGPRRADKWTYVEQMVAAPSTAAKVGFALYGCEKGKVWFDDVALLGTPSAQAARGTPRLDGKLDDACWSPRRAITAFAQHPGDALPANPTQAWIAYDDENLYFAFRCSHPKGAKLRVTDTRRDGKVWLDDAVEIFLAPHRRRGDYFQFCVNAAGALRDTQGRAKVEWDSGARAKVAREPDAWTVEIAIPFERLGVDLDVNEWWGVNLVRDDWTHGRGQRLVYTWSLGGFHNPGRFGKVRIAADLSKFWRVSLAGQADRVAAGRKRLARELSDARLSPAMRKRADEILADVDQRIAALRGVASGSASLPKGGWNAVRRELDTAQAALRQARAAALEALFNAEGGDAKSGFRVVIAHSLQKVRRTGPVTDGVIARRVTLGAARDETESFQLVVIPSGRALKHVTVEAGDLVGPKGRIPLRWRRVGYVETGIPRYKPLYVGWWADPLLPPGPFDVKAGERQPLWFSVSVPADAAPGRYEGQVTIRCGAASVRAPVSLRVRSFRLPRPGTLAAPFGLYLSSLSSWWYGRGPRRLPIETYVRWCKFMGEYRLTPKNIAREYVKDTFRKTHRHEIDMTALHQTIGQLAPRYYPPYSFGLFRLPNAGTVRRYLKRSPEAARKYLDGYVKLVDAYAKEWRRQKFPFKAFLYGCDEPRSPMLPILRDAYVKFQKVAPEFPIMQTISHRNPYELVGRVGVWCPLTPSLESPFYAERKKAGDMLWGYVCCSPRPPYANFFVDQPATAHRVLFWQLRKAGATGLLYYCVCAWKGIPNAASGKPCFPDVPIHLSDHWTCKRFKVNGDGLLVYPGKNMTPIPSIRLEIIRDGIEDYEYLALLDRLVRRAKALPASKRPSADLLKQAETLCKVPSTITRSLIDYTSDASLIFEQRRRVADMIERLERALAAAR